MSDRSRTAVVVAAVLLAAAAVVGGGLWWVDQQLSGVPGPGEPVEFTIEEGATAAQVGAALEERGVVRNGLGFRLVARSRDLDSRLLAGTYDLETGMSVDEAINALLAGPREPEALRFTVREGLSVPLTLAELADQTPHGVGDYRAVLDARLEAGGNAPDLLRLPEWLPDPSRLPDTVRDPFEGMLFPETYAVPVDAGPRVVLQRMVDQLAEEMREQVEDLDASRDLDRYRAMIIASLIERETRVADERGTVSGVIHNRLEAGMPLQIDATVLYALGRHRERVLTEDTEVASPYNTYQHPGLPPSPIAGFSAASLDAALRPADVEFRYYVLSPECDGSHVFATSLDEHRENVAAYRDAGRCPVPEPTDTLTGDATAEPPGAGGTSTDGPVGGATTPGLSDRP